MNRVRTLIAAIALSTVPLVSACTTVEDALGTATTTPVCQTTVADDKARWAAEAAYNAPATAYRAANERGLFEGRDALKQQIKSTLQTMASYLRGVRAAHAACDSATLLNYKGSLDKLEAEVLPLIPR